MAVIKESECGGWARTCLGSARASRAGDGAPAIANFLSGTLRRGAAMCTRGRVRSPNEEPQCPP
jgi:hypothetical protein